jgi:hypothetical protein
MPTRCTDDGSEWSTGPIRPGPMLDRPGGHSAVQTTPIVKGFPVTQKWPRIRLGSSLPPSGDTGRTCQRPRLSQCWAFGSSRRSKTSSARVLKLLALLDMSVITPSLALALKGHHGCPKLKIDAVPWAEFRSGSAGLGLKKGNLRSRSRLRRCIRSRLPTRATTLEDGSRQAC